jgi:hypothetical protein
MAWDVMAAEHLAAPIHEQSGRTSTDLDVAIEELESSAARR